MGKVIKEIREVTRITNNEFALNQKIGRNYNKAEQMKMYRTLQGLLEDELIHLMTIMTLEKRIKSELSD